MVQPRNNDKSNNEHMDFYDFAESRRGWQIAVVGKNSGEVPSRYVAERRFEYAGGQRASLWIEMLEDKHLHHHFAAHVSIPFSAGPQESYAARPNPRRTSGFDGVKEWVIEREKLLTVPLQIAEARTFARAWELATGMGSKGLWMASYIFDFDFEGTSDVIIRKLIRACAPRLVQALAAPNV